MGPERSLQRAEIGDQGVDVVAPQTDDWHAIARLHPLRILEPAPQIARIVRQRAGGDRATTGEVRKIGAETCAGVRTGNRVTEIARTRHEYFLAACCPCLRHR